MNADAALSRLLGGLDVDRFLSCSYLKVPFAGEKAAVPWSESEDSATLQSLLEASGANVVVGKQGTHYAGSQPRGMQEAQEVGKQGYTLDVRGVQNFHPGIAEIARVFSAVFQAPVDVHLFVTPARQPGFGWHYDAEEVFVLQIRGEKLWQLQKNTVHPWPLIDGIPENQKHEREITPVQQCRLSPGDWLYIPGGYWHRTTADSWSMSLSIGVNAPTAIDYFGFLRNQLVRSILWRQRLPPIDMGGSNMAADKEIYRTLIASLIDDLAATMTSDYCIQSFLETRASPFELSKDTSTQSLAHDSR